MYTTSYTKLVQKFVYSFKQIIHILNTMPPLFKFTEKCIFTDYTIIIPCVSVGNVPQLTVDLIITSLKLRKVGSLWHPAIVSTVGADPYIKKGPNLATACDIYANDDRKLAAIQFRSTVTPRLAASFFEEFANDLNNLHFRDVVLLTSSFDSEMHVVSPHKFYYVSNSEKCRKLFECLNLKPKEAELDGTYFVHGGGFGVKLYEALTNVRAELSTSLIIKFTSEGDNRPDAADMFEVLTKSVDGMHNFSMEQVEAPFSWNYVFGGPPPREIY